MKRQKRLTRKQRAMERKSPYGIERRDAEPATRTLYPYQQSFAPLIASFNGIQFPVESIEYDSDL